MNRIPNMNRLTAEIYQQGSTSIAYFAHPKKTDGVMFETQYPGGLYGVGQFSLNQAVLLEPPVRGGYKIQFRNYLDSVYEGFVGGREFSFGALTAGLNYDLMGAFGFFLAKNGIRKPWSDRDVSENSWPLDTSVTSGMDKCNVDRNSRLRFIPKAEAWVTNDAYQIVYTMPTGQVIRNIAYDYATAGANFTAEFYDATNGASAASAGTGKNYAPGTPVQAIGIRYRCTSNTTPTSDGAYHATFTNLTVYSETSSINLTEIATDIIGYLSDLNSDTSYLDSNTRSVTPFAITDWMTYDAILNAAAKYGDSSNNPWAFGCLGSEMATSPDGKPVLYIEQQPDPKSTSFDYIINVNDRDHVQVPFTPYQDFGQIENWIPVGYTDINGRQQWVTPDDDATLKNASSIAIYGTRIPANPPNIGPATQALAIAYGNRYHNNMAWPVWTGQVSVLEYINTTYGSRLPASQIQAGKILRMGNFLENMTGVTTNEAVQMLVAHTHYDDETHTTTLSFGRRDFISELDFSFPVTWDDTVPDAENGGGGGGGRLNWKRQYGLTPGTPAWDEAVKLGRVAWKKKYPNKKRVR